jgi:cell division protein FtsQ
VRDELQRRGLLATAIHLENRVRPGWVAVKVQPGATAPRQ